MKAIPKVSLCSFFPSAVDDFAMANMVQQLTPTRDRVGSLAEKEMLRENFTSYSSKRLYPIKHCSFALTDSIAINSNRVSPVMLILSVDGDKTKSFRF